MSPKHRKAIQAINRDGIVLVFPIDNQKDPHSLWYELHPKTKMRWEWDDEGDSKVADLWHLRTQLSTTREVVYTKWFRNRATYFSRELFTACLCLSLRNLPILSRESHEIMETLRMDSPLSTRQLKESVGLQGRLLEPLFNKSMKKLWDSFQIMAFGEVEDSSFPSLAVGATQTLFEDLFEEAQSMQPVTAQKLIDAKMPQGSAWRKYWDKNKTGLTKSRAQV
jgi:hypothetical protein